MSSLVGVYWVVNLAVWSLWRLFKWFALVSHERLSHNYKAQKQLFNTKRPPTQRFVAVTVRIVDIVCKVYARTIKPTACIVDVETLFAENNLLRRHSASSCSVPQQTNQFRIRFLIVLFLDDFEFMHELWLNGAIAYSFNFQNLEVGVFFGSVKAILYELTLQLICDKLDFGFLLVWRQVVKQVKMNSLILFFDFNSAQRVRVAGANKVVLVVLLHQERVRRLLFTIQTQVGKVTICESFPDTLNASLANCGISCFKGAYLWTECKVVIPIQIVSMAEVLTLGLKVSCSSCKWTL